VRVKGDKVYVKLEKWEQAVYETDCCLLYQQI
jgi:hypothetical protein